MTHYAPPVTVLTGLQPQPAPSTPDYCGVEGMEECLPMWRWGDLIGGNMPNTTGDQNSLSETWTDIIFALGGLMWRIAGFFVNLASDALNTLASMADTGLGFIASLMPPAVYMVLFVLAMVGVFWSQEKGFSNIRTAGFRVLRWGFLTALAGSIIVAAGLDVAADKPNGGRDNAGQVVLSPSWFATLISDAAEPVLAASANTLSGDFAVSESVDALHCAKYENALSYPDHLTGEGETTRIAVNQIWMNLYYRPWTRSVLGTDEAAARAGCRIAEWRAKIPAEHQEIVTCAAVEQENWKQRLDMTSNNCYWGASGVKNIGNITIPPQQAGSGGTNTDPGRPREVQISSDINVTYGRRIQWQQPQLYGSTRLAEAVTPWIVCEYDPDATQWIASEAAQPWVNSQKSETVARFRYVHNRQGVRYQGNIEEACEKWWRGFPEDSDREDEDRCDVIIGTFYHCAIDEEARDTEIAKLIEEDYPDADDEQKERLATNLSLAFAAGNERPSSSEIESTPLPYGSMQDLHRLWAAPPEITSDPLTAALGGDYGLNSGDKITGFINAFLYGGAVLIITGMVFLGGLWVLLAAVLLPFALFSLTLEGRPRTISKKVFSYAKRGLLFSIGGNAILLVVIFMLTMIRSLFNQSGYTAGSAYTMAGLLLLGAFFLFRTEGAPRAKLRQAKTNLINTYSKAKRDILNPVESLKEKARSEVSLRSPQIFDTQYLYAIREAIRRKGANTSKLGWEEGAPDSWDGVIINNGRVESLDMSECGLTEIPAEINKLKFLKRLICRRNIILELPLFLTKMELLRHIDISGTRTLRVDGKPIPDAFGERTDMTIVVRGCPNLEIERVSEKVERILQR